MSSFSPISDTDLARARQDGAFRQKLLQRSLDGLLIKLQRQRQAPGSNVATAAQLREGVTLAVRLAELIQANAERLRKP